MDQKNLAVKLLVLITLISISFYLIFSFNLYSKEGVMGIRHYISSFGVFSGLVFVIAFSIRTFILIIPYFAMVILGGSVFGPTNGFIYSMCGVFCSASAAFLIGRFLGKEYVQKIIKGKIEALDEKAEQHGFKIIFIMRLSTIFPFDVMNYAVGVSKIKYRDYILGTMLGMLPETFSLVFFGSSLHKPFSKRFFISLACILITIGVPLIYKKIRKGKNEFN